MISIISESRENKENKMNYDGYNSDEERDDGRDKRKEKEMKERVRIINASLFVVESILNRQRRIEDPVLKYTVLVDKLLMLVDMGVGAMKGFVSENEKYPPELRDRLDNVAESLQNDLENLAKWIRHPIYSPEHPYGNGVMTRSKENFMAHSGDSTDE